MTQDKGKEIVFVNRYYRPDESATAQILTDLAEHLAAEGMRVRIVTSRLDYVSGKRLHAARESVAGVAVERIWTTAFGRKPLWGRALDYLTYYGHVLWHLVWKTGRQTTLVMKTDPPMLSVIGAVVKSVRGVRLVNWNQDIFPEVVMPEMGEAGGMKARILRGVRVVRDWSWRRAEMNVVLSEDMGRLLAERGVVAEKIQELGNWAVQTADAVAVVEAEAAARRLRNEWGLAGKMVVGYSGNLGRVHDWRTLYEAAERLRAREDICYLVIGGGHGYEALRAAVEAGGLGGRFVFRGYQPKAQLAASLRIADVHWFSLQAAMTQLVYPSKFYGILAAGRGALFIGERDSALARLIEAEGIGACYTEGDSGGLARCIERLADLPELREAWGRAAGTLATGALSRRAALANWAAALGRTV